MPVGVGDVPPSRVYVDGMNWGYKAARTKLDKSGTLIIAKRGFLCRSAHEANLSKADKVDRVAPGDVIHLYYSGGGKVHELGAYEVIGPEQHPKPGLFGERVEGTALYRVLDPAFIREIDKDGAYEPDAKLGQFTGWIVEKRGKARPYEPKAFPGQSTLVPLGEP